MANDIICEISSENELICEMSSAGEIVVEVSGMTYQSVAAELAGKASVEDVALKADKTYVDSQDALKADSADLALKADKTYVDLQDAALSLQLNDKANKEKLVGALHITNTFFDCSQIAVDPVTDTLTISSHGLSDGTIVAISLRRKESGKVPLHGQPSGLRLFVVNATTNTLQLSLSNGGSPIDFTTSGSTTLGDWILDVPTISASSIITGLTKSKYLVKFRGNIVTYLNIAIGITGNRPGANLYFYQYTGASERPDYIAIDGILSNNSGTLMFNGEWGSKCASVNGYVDAFNRVGSGIYIATLNTSYDDSEIISSISICNNVLTTAVLYGHGSRLEVFEID